MKVKLFRKGRFVGIVSPNFHNLEEKEDLIWEKLDLPSLNSRR